MADFAPPTGPPPPQVPEGWKSVWNAQYSAWFFVNTFTKQSQWDKPTEPVYAHSSDGAPPGAPPGYDHSTHPGQAGDVKTNPYTSGAPMTADERLARQLQEQEQQNASRGAGGQSSYAPAYGQGGAYGEASPYGQQQQQPYGQQQQYGQQQAGAVPEKRGLLSKLTGAIGGGSASRPQQGYGQQGGYGGGGYPQQGYGRGGYPPQQGGYYQGQQQMQPQRAGMGGMGGMGAGLLGAGGGLIGGAMLANAFEGGDGGGYGGGGDDGGGGGGDDGGGGGGDF